MFEHWARMAVNAGRLLAGPSPVDWRYNRDHVGSLVRTLSEGDLERLQRVSPAEGYVSTPVDGIGAAFTDAGRLCYLIFPHTSFTHQIPFYATESEGGSNERLEGSFGGVRRRGDSGPPTWLWSDTFDQEMTYEDGTGLLSVTYEGTGLRVAETAYVYPGSNVLVRKFTVENVGDERFDGEFVYHTRANVTDEDQTFVAWNSHRNRLTGDGGLRWTDLEGPYALAVWGRHGDGRSATATLPDVEGPSRSAGSVTGRYLDGRLRFDCSLAPGESTTASVFVGDGREPVPRDPPGPSSADDRQAAAREWWRDWLSDVETDVGTGFEDLYVRSVVVLASLVDPETGSVAAAPNLQPMYYPSWIRDAAFVAVALARAGKPALARTILGEFPPRVQESDGSFRQCYNSRGEFVGVVDVENDQQPLYAWAVAGVYDATGDEAFVERTWPAVSGALDYTVQAVDGRGLLEPSLDIAEYPEHVRQSLWTNTFAYRGLLDGAALADVVGAPDDAERYRTTAESLGDAIHREFFERVDDGRGYLVVRDANGGVEEVFLYDAAAVYPTEWAVDYGEVDRLRSDLVEMVGDEWHAWIPGSLMAATTFFEYGPAKEGENFLAEVARETTAAGHLKEMRGEDGGHYFASPLAWSHASFVLANRAAARRRSAPETDAGRPR